MLHRAWAMGQTVVRHDGLDVGATSLFGAMMMKLLRRMLNGKRPPSHIAVFFDPPRADSWRREMYANYKANRPDMDAALSVQIPLMKDICHAMGVSHATAPRHEADDLIAAYVEDAASRGDFCTIISSDKDLMQLVRPGVLQYNSVQDKWFNEAAVIEKFGVNPTQVADYLALAGDAVDGVPGAPGIGAKSAAALLVEFGSVETILRCCDDIQKKSWRRIISENHEVIRLSRMLVALDHAAAPRLLSIVQMRSPEPLRAWQGLQDWRSINIK